MVFRRFQCVFIGWVVLAFGFGDRFMVVFECLWWFSGVFTVVVDGFMVISECF